MVFNATFNNILVKIIVAVKKKMFFLFKSKIAFKVCIVSFEFAEVN